MERIVSWKPVALLCLSSLLGCSTQSTLTSASFGGFQTAQERSDGSVSLLDEEGKAVHVRPQDTLKIALTDGQVVELQGKYLCRAEQGLSRYRGDGSCGQAEWIGAWAEISSIEVEQFDGASTVGVATIAAVVVVGVVIALVSESKSSGKGGSSKTERILASPSTGGGAAAPKPAAPAATPVRPRPSHRHGHGHRGGVNVNVLIFPGVNTSSSSTTFGPEEGESPLLTPEDRPLFSDRAIRRSSFQLSLRAEGGACVGSEGCTHSSLRLGALLGDLVELSGGLRWEQLRQGFSPMAMFGVGLQGRFPRHPSLALMLGTQIALGEETRVTPQAGLRLHLGEGFWFGVQPLAVTFFVGDRVAYSPSLDLAYTF